MQNPTPTAAVPNPQPQTATKTYAAVFGSGLTFLACWLLNTYAHANIPDALTGTVTVFVTSALVYFIPNLAKVPTT